MATRLDPAELQSILVELRRIVEACRELAPLSRGLDVTNTPTDLELSSVHLSVLDLAKLAMAQAEDLLVAVPKVVLSDELEDLAALVKLEIEDRLQKLAGALALPRLPFWQKAYNAAGLGAKVLKAAIAVENSLCAHCGLQSELSLRHEIEDAITARQAYCKLWMSLPPEEPASQKEVEARIRGAATSIALLTGREIFLDLRLEDRRILLSLQRRIRQWLSGGDIKVSGRHLWQDVANAFRLLAGINHRIELLVHDEGLVAELRRELSQASESDSAFVPLRNETLRARFRRLLGRDEELDRLLIDRDHERKAPELLAILERMARRWQRPEPHQRESALWGLSTLDPGSANLVDPPN